MKVGIGKGSAIARPRIRISMPACPRRLPRDVSKNPVPDAALQDLTQHNWERIANAVPFSVSHHPSISILYSFGEGDSPLADIALVPNGPLIKPPCSPSRCLRAQHLLRRGRNMSLY